MQIRRTFLTTFASLALGAAMPSWADSITHEMGVTDVPDTPERIVVLEFSYVDALASLGVAPVGIADDNNRDRIIPAYTDVIGDEWVSVGTRKTPSLEVIASLQPDLIIVDLTRHEAAYDTLSEIAPTIVLDSLGGDYFAALEQMEVIGAALGRADEAAVRVATHKAVMDDYAAQIAEVSDGVVAQFGVTNATGLWLHSPMSYNGSLLEMFGFSSTMTPGEGEVYETNYVPTTLEQLSVVDPDILILGKYADPAFTDGWVGEPLYENLKSVSNGAVHTVTAHNWSRLRGLLAAELMAQDLIAIMSQAGATN
ncbi:Fe(3+) dicitrate ABC transporter substrate-binding protein [Thalassobium sp. R2A62]|uniref:ABC transporter substrate-binding protein n=1 Tax=Thalassobium sp. R2A62 TaxID=633131 RepID=UPI0001B1CB37|nr:Fe(3+) dicitrate ABC transporter substrate-binding protein [Thalassobium sp. R2A62]EET47354.1 iron(III) dicitrate-binding periplasmic protein [Thalassobium sp. R2A62]